ISESGHRISVDVPGSNMTQAWDMNNAGDVVGVWGKPEDGHGSIVIDGVPFHGFLRDRHGNFIKIDYPGSFDTHLFGINDWGDMVGSYVDQEGKIHGLIARPGDQQAEMMRSVRPTIVNASFGGAQPAKRRAPGVRVALMPVIPEDRSL